MTVELYIPKEFECDYENEALKIVGEFKFQVQLFLVARKVSCGNAQLIFPANQEKLHMKSYIRIQSALKSITKKKLHLRVESAVENSMIERFGRKKNLL